VLYNINTVVSDVFGRLHYMDRRGSGIGRIMNSYAEFVAKPEFYSSDHHFSVILPNRSMAELSQIEFAETQLSAEKPQLSPGKPQLSTEKPQLSNEKQQLSHGSVETDWEFDDIRKMPLNREQRRQLPKNMDNPIEIRDVIKGPALMVLPIAVYQ